MRIHLISRLNHQNLASTQWRRVHPRETPLHFRGTSILRESSTSELVTTKIQWPSTEIKRTSVSQTNKLRRRMLRLLRNWTNSTFNKKSQASWRGVMNYALPLPWTNCSVRDLNFLNTTSRLPLTKRKEITEEYRGWEENEEEEEGLNDEFERFSF